LLGGFEIQYYNFSDYNKVDKLFIRKMFGKIKLALGGQGQSNQNSLQKEVQNNQNQKA
jgi:hypothetical protein